MRTICLTFAVVACISGSGRAAAQGLTLELESSLGGTVVVHDNDASDADPLVGSVVFNGTLNGFDLAVGVGLSKPHLGSSTVAELSASAIVVASTTAMIRISVTDTDYWLSPSTGTGTLAMGVGGTSEGASQFQAYLDEDNSPFGRSCSPGLQGPFSGAYDDTLAASCSQSGAFSLTVDSLHLLSAGEVMSFGSSLTFAPIGNPRGGEGCTPGYWRNHTEDWVFFSPGDSYETIFGVDVTPYVRKSDITLLQGTKTGGGGAKALIRHSSAALLNAAHPEVDYAFTVGQVIQLVEAAFASGDFETAKNIFQVENELGCDIDS